MKKLPYNFLYLKYFRDAARFGSISKAALENHVSQSAVSQGIAKLEESLGAQLILHQPNTFRLTSFGERLAEKSHEIFSTIRALEEELTSTAGELKRLSFASMHSLAYLILPKLLKRATKKWPQLEVTFRLAHTDGVMDMVKRGQVDFGLSLDNEDFSAFQCREIFSGEYALYAAKSLKMWINCLSSFPKSAKRFLLFLNRIKNDSVKSLKS